MSKSPKVLLISAFDFHGNSATSITLRNMFSDWDKNKIALIHVVSEPYESKDENVFVLYERFFEIENKRHKNDFVSKLRSERSLLVGVEGALENSKISNKKRILNKIHTTVSAHKSLIPYKYTTQLDAFIKDFAPDVIYSPLGSVGIMQLTYSISKQYKINIVPHFMDDWINTMYENNKLTIIPRLVKHLYFRKVLNLTKKGLTISEIMATEYKEKYHLPFFALMNCVDIPDKQSTNTDVNNNPKIFSYCGGLHLNRWKSLVELCKSIIRCDLTVDVQVYIYTKPEDWEHYNAYFNKFDFVKYKGFISTDELYIEQNKHDVLVHVESFDESVVKYTRLSISTKIPEYLSRGRLLLAIGPDNIASIKYLKDNQSAIVIDALIDDLFDSKLKEIIFLSNIETTKNGYQLFLKNHTKEIQSQMLLKVLSYKINKKQNYDKKNN